MAIKASNQITLVDVTDAYSALLSNDGYTFVGNTTGAPSGLSCITQVTAYRGSEQCSTIRISAVQCPSGISASISDDNTSSPTITFTTINTIKDSCEAIIAIIVDEIEIYKRFLFSVAKAGADGKGIKKTEVTYQVGESGTTPPTGTWMSTVQETTTEKPYLWTRMIITYTDNTTSTSYSVSTSLSGSSIDGIDIGGRNLVSEYDFTLLSASSSSAITITDDDSGNVTITDSSGTIISDDNNGNVTIANSSGITITDDGAGNISLAASESGSTSGETPVLFRSFIIDSEDADKLTISVNAAYDGSNATRTGVYSVSIYNVNSDETLGAILVSAVELDIDGKRHSCTMNISEKTNSLVVVRIGMSSTDAAESGIIINFSKLKIEKGNQATDWTPSPDDTEEAISEIRSTMTSQKSEIISSCESIILSALETYVETGEYDEFKQTVTSQLEVLANRITMTFSTVTQQVTDVDGDLQTKFNELYKYITFSGENAITIGSSDSSIKLILDNDAILFTKDDVIFGSWDGNNFHTGNIIVDVNERAQFGSFAFLPNADGSLSFVKVGD